MVVNKNEYVQKEKVDAIVNDLSKKLKSELKDELESVYIFGSYTFGKISKQRPDINWFVIFKNRASAEDYLKVGKILDDLVQKYEKEDIGIRLEFRPFRYIYPKVKKDKEVVIHFTLVEGADKPNNFGMSGFFLEGARSSKKLIFGKDVLAELKLKYDKEELRKAFFVAVIFRAQLVRTPTQFSEEDHDLLFQESLSIGKSFLYYGLEAGMTDEELQNMKFLEFIQDKEKMIRFYEERYSKEIAESAKTILEARAKYIQWKKDKERAKKVFKAAVVISNAVMKEFATKLFG